MLGFGLEAECIMQNGELIIKLVKAMPSGDYDEYILADLIKDGLWRRTIEGISAQTQESSSYHRDHA